MSKAAVDNVRSVTLGVTDPAASARFFTDVWGLRQVAEAAGTVYLRATGSFHHVLALTGRPQAAILCVDMTAPDRAAVDGLAASVRAAGGTELGAPAALREPGGGYGFSFRDPEGRTIRVIAEDSRHADGALVGDRPSKVAHLVLNTRDRAGISAFYTRALGYRVIDRTRIMTFLCCNSDHHSLAFADGDGPTLNHLAFDMKDVDSVMRGAGRLRDRGFPIEWGVGRHGPGNNVFAYFCGPDDLVVEYTTEVEQVDASYKPGEPENWTWPPGRIDHWGIGVGPTDRMKAAQNRIGFTSDPARPAA